ncbi:hypothetical protein JCM18237_17350 [Halorubrum luteum]
MLFDSVEFNEDAIFDSVNFEKGASFEGAIFEQKVDFWRAKFRGRGDFEDADFKGEINFGQSEFYEYANFCDLELDKSQFDGANLTDVEFTDTSLCEANLESALLSRATLLGTDLRGAKFNGVVLGDARIDENTRFLGYPNEDTDSSPHTFSAIYSKPRCIYDPNYKGDSDETDVGKAKSVYRTLEELADKAARSRLQSQCFVRRQDLQKEGYKQDAKKTESWQERLIASARYIRAKVARGTLLYGESPWRIIGGSIGFILLAALLYPLDEWLRPVGEDPITYSRILNGEWSLLLESLYFSTLTFTTLGMGDYEPIGVGQMLATLNTALGAILIALLVFVLGRRAAR